MATILPSRFKEPKLVHAIEVLTGINSKGLLDGGGLVQISTDGKEFTTIGKLDRGAAKAVLKDNRVRAVRLFAGFRQREPMVVRAINLQLMIEVSGAVRNPSAAIGAGNVAVTAGDTEFTAPIGDCAVPVINRDFTLTFDSGGTPCTFSGPISGSGKVEISAGGLNAAVTLSGKAPNTMRGTWTVKAGRVVLAKQPGVDALLGTIIVAGRGGHSGLIWNGSEQINDAAHVQLLSSDEDEPAGRPERVPATRSAG